MQRRLPIKYPKNWGETKEILRDLDLRWFQLGKISDKYHKSKEWIRIAKDINVLCKMAREKVEEAKKTLDSVKEICAIVKIISASFDLSFHKKNLKTFEIWMRSKKIPSIL